MKAPDIEYRIGNSSDALALIEMMIEKLKFCGHGKPEKLCVPFFVKALQTLKDAIEREVV